MNYERALLSVYIEATIFFIIGVIMFFIATEMI
jgi:hypothetical protein